MITPTRGGNNIDMKKILYFNLILTLLCQHLYSQNINNCKKVDYAQKSALDKFVGTWEWKLSNDKFIVKFKKVVLKTPEVSYDALAGGYKYVKDGKEVSNYLEFYSEEIIAIGPVNKEKNNFVITGSEKGNGQTQLFFSDEKQDRRIEVLIQIPVNKPNELIWISKDGGGTGLKVSKVGPNASSKNKIFEGKKRVIPLDAIPVPVRWVMTRIK